MVLSDLYCCRPVALPGLIYWGGGGNKTVAYPDVLQLFNGEIYPVGISIQKSLIKMAIYKIYGMKWGQAPPQFTLAGHGLLGPPPEAYDVD